MRVLAAATMLILSSALAPSFAQQPGNAPAPSQPQNVPVQPERSPQQSEQARAEQEQKRGDDVRVGRDWRAQERDDRGDRAMGGRDRDYRTEGRSSRMDGETVADRGSAIAIAAIIATAGAIWMSRSGPAARQNLRRV